MRAAMTLHRLPVTLHEIDVDLDSALQARFTNDVPVVYVNGREAFRHHVDVGDFTNYIRNEPRPSSPQPRRRVRGGHSPRRRVFRAAAVSRH